MSCFAVPGGCWYRQVDRPLLPFLSTLTHSLGTLGVVDNDVVELSNLQRQILHTDDRIGVAKSISAKEALLKCVLF